MASKDDLLDSRCLTSQSHSTIGVSRFPTTPGQCIQILDTDNLWSLSLDQQIKVLLAAKDFEQTVLRPCFNVKRCGLAYNGVDRIQLTPFHGLSDQWRPISAGQTQRSDQYAGFIWTRESPHADKADLDRLRNSFAAKTKLATSDTTFLGESSDDNLFARLIRGEIPSWRAWEDAEHVACFSPFSNTLGSVVLVPRKHLSSDIFGLASADFCTLMEAAGKIVEVMKEVLDCERIGMFFEGFEIDYAHVKLYPIYSKASGRLPVEGPSDEFYETYPGHMTTRLGPRASQEALDETVQKVLRWSSATAAGQ